jgi:hypothetical protein
MNDEAKRSRHLAEFTTHGVGTLLAIQAIAGSGIERDDLGQQLQSAAEEAQAGISAG